MQKIMSDQVFQSISDYCGHFRDQLDKIETFSDSLYSKILTATLLDALATGRYPKKQVGKRYIALIKNYANWDARNRVSPIQYDLYVQRHIDTAAIGDVSKHLAALAKTMRATCEREQFLAITEDPFVDTLMAMQPTDKECGALDQTTHLALLYAYRNCLVHEFREPGYGYEFDRKRLEPFYFQWLQAGADIDPDPPQLTYPLNWWFGIARTVINGLEAFYRETCLDPYNRHEFGSLWSRKKGA